MSYLGVPPFGQTLRSVEEHTATEGQTVFSVNGGYYPTFIDVLLNGVELYSGDFTATNGTEVVLTTGASAGDELKTVVYWSVSMIDSYRKTEVDTLLEDVTATTVTATTNSSSSNYKVPFLNTIYSTTGDYEVLQDSSGNFIYNPSSNQLNNVVLGSGVTFSSGNSLPNPSSYTKGGMYGASTSSYAACGYGSGGGYYSSALGVDAYSAGSFGVAVGAQSIVNNDYGIAVGRLARSYSGAVAVGHNTGNTGSAIPAALLGSQVSSGNVSSGSGVVALRGTDASSVWDIPNSGFFVDPIRSGSASNTLMYDTSTKEIVYGESAGGGGGTAFNLVVDNAPVLTPAFTPEYLNFVQGEGINLSVVTGPTYMNVTISASGGGGGASSPTPLPEFSSPQATGPVWFNLDLAFPTDTEMLAAKDWFIALAAGTAVFETDNVSLGNRYIIVFDPFTTQSNPDNWWTGFTNGFWYLSIPTPYIYVYDYLSPATGNNGSITQG